MKDGDFWRKFRELQLKCKKDTLDFEKHFKFDSVNTVKWIELKVPEGYSELKTRSLVEQIDELQKDFGLDFDIQDESDVIIMVGDETYYDVCKTRFMKHLNKIAPIQQIEITFIFEPDQ